MDREEESEKRRCKHEIFDKLLRLTNIEGEVRKTTLVYKGNSCFKSVDRYLETLLQKELMKKTGPFYSITEKGIEFIQTFHRLQRFLK